MLIVVADPIIRVGVQDILRSNFCPIKCLQLAAFLCRQLRTPESDTILLSGESVLPCFICSKRISRHRESSQGLYEIFSSFYLHHSLVMPLKLTPIHVWNK